MRLFSGFFLSSIVTCEFNKLLIVLFDQKVERAQGNTWK